jgi:hypothetical protein
MPRPAFLRARFFPLHCSYSLRAVAPAKDDRLTPLLHLRSPSGVHFRYVVVGNLLVQRTGLQREETEAPLLLGGPIHLTPHWVSMLGIGLSWSWACIREPSCTGRGLPRRAPTCAGCTGVHRSSQIFTMRQPIQFFSPAPRAGVRAARCSWDPFGMQLAVAIYSRAQSYGIRAMW